MGLEELNSYSINYHGTGCPGGSESMGRGQASCSPPTPALLSGSRRGLGRALAPLPLTTFLPSGRLGLLRSSSPPHWECLVLEPTAWGEV